MGGAARREDREFRAATEVGSREIAIAFSEDVERRAAWQIASPVREVLLWVANQDWPASSSAMATSSVSGATVKESCGS